LFLGEEQFSRNLSVIAANSQFIIHNSQFIIVYPFFVPDFLYRLQYTQG